MKQKEIIRAFEEAVEALGATVRYEKGNFRGGRCSVDGEPLVVLNKRHSPDVHMNILAEVLREMPVDTIYLRPAVRQALEEIWDEQPSSA